MISCTPGSLPRPQVHPRHAHVVGTQFAAVDRLAVALDAVVEVLVEVHARFGRHVVERNAAVGEQHVHFAAFQRPPVRRLQCPGPRGIRVAVGGRGRCRGRRGADPGSRRRRREAVGRRDRGALRRRQPHGRRDAGRGVGRQRVDPAGARRVRRLDFGAGRGAGHQGRRRVAQVVAEPVGPVHGLKAAIRVGVHRRPLAVQGDGLLRVPLLGLDRLPVERVGVLPGRRDGRQLAEAGKPAKQDELKRGARQRRPYCYPTGWARAMAKGHKCARPGAVRAAVWMRRLRA